MTCSKAVEIIKNYKKRYLFPPRANWSDYQFRLRSYGRYFADKLIDMLSEAPIGTDAIFIVEKLEDSIDDWIIAHIPDLQHQNDRMFMACLMFTGMRPGEIYGLRWEDISPDEGIIHIRRAIAFCKNKAIIGDTKTKAGVRSIPLSPRLLKFLEPCGEEGFIINREGEPYTEQAHKRTWERIKRTIDVHGMTPYIGRHTYLTALNREGVDLKTIQAIAGHEDERMALRTYIHCDETLVNNAGKAMEARFERMTAM